MAEARDEGAADGSPRAPKPPLREVAALFLRLGLTAFGGPAAHIALMEDEVVRRRRWVTPERFLDMLGAANLIPGPSSTELAIFIGYEQAGLAGLALAGACFILPAALLTAALAWAYVRFGRLPHASGVLYGVKPVVIAVVAQALVGLFPKALKSRPLGALGVLAVAAAVLGADPLAVMLAAGALSAAARALRARGDGGGPARSALVLPGLDDLRRILGLGAPVAVGVAVPVTLGALFLVFLKVGAVVFGSGYVLLAFLRADLVERLKWISEAQLVDAVAVGQLTPGPVFTTATFIGYLVGGGWGAVVATIGIFLPGFALVAAIRPIVARVRRSAAAGAFLDGVNVAALALMAVVTAQIARAALVDLCTIALAAASAVLLLRFKVRSTWILLGGAVVGLLAR